MNQGSSTEGAAVRQLILLPVLGLHTLSVAVGGVSGAHRLTTCTNHTALLVLENILRGDGCFTKKGLDDLSSFKHSPDV